MYTGNFKEEEKVVVGSILNSKFDNRTPIGIAKNTSLSLTKVRYILNRSRILREVTTNNKKDLWKIATI